MTIIRQECFFSIQELYEMAPPQKYAAIIESIDLDMIYHAISKKSQYGAPESINYPALISAFFIRYVERIPTVKDLVRRLKDDVSFRMNCGFRLTDDPPSEASFSRLVTKLSATHILERVEEKVLKTAIDAGFITDDTVAIDATHVPARDQAPTQKAGADGASDEYTVYAQPIAAQLDVDLDTLRDSVPQTPNWGIKKNSEGKHAYWYGFKAHIAVSAGSQYILQSLFSGGQLNDGKAAIPLLKGIQSRLSLPDLRYQTMDAGYDDQSIYTQVYQMGQQSVIAYNVRNEKQKDGFTQHFGPTCLREHPYRYDSYDSKYETLKYTQPKECRDCPLVQEGLCQKVWKIKITQDLRRYTAPARGSKKWKHIYKRRTSVERVNAYLKSFFQLNNVRYRTGQRAQVHFNAVTIIYNASKLAADTMNASMTHVQTA